MLVEEKEETETKEEEKDGKRRCLCHKVTTQMTEKCVKSEEDMQRKDFLKEKRFPEGEEIH